MASVASTYARAFADVVLGGHLDANRAIPVLDAIVARDGISKQVRNLLAVLIDHRRVHFLEPVIRQLEKELDARLGFAEADITSARELGDAEKREFEAQVGKLTGKKVRAHYAQDASLLGGAVVRVGSTIYDGSVKGQLERMKEALSL